MEIDYERSIRTISDRLKEIEDISLEDDSYNDEFLELNKILTLFRNVLKIERFRNGHTASYKLFKMTPERGNMTFS